MRYSDVAWWCIWREKICLIHWQKTAVSALRQTPELSDSTKDTTLSPESQRPKWEKSPLILRSRRRPTSNCAAELIYEYQVPPQLAINGDETAVLLVSRANRTRNIRGANRIRMLGMVEDKAQITTTIFVTEAGDVLPYQMISESKTDRCHPKHANPDDCVWTHTASHWQLVITSAPWWRQSSCLSRTGWLKP